MDGTGKNNEGYEGPPTYAPPSYPSHQQYPPPPPTQTAVINTTVVNNQQPMMTHVTVAPKPQSYCCMSCCILWFFNLLLGGIAFVFSMLSINAFDGGNLEKARTYGRVAFWLNITGIIVSSILIIVIIAALAG